MNRKGSLIVVSGPSGTGKSTILRRLMETRDNLHFSVSATTRPPREGEVDGKDYFFVTRERFQEMVDENAFLEYAEYVGNRYGTPKDDADAQLARGWDVYLDIEVQGAMQVKRQRPDSLFIFLMPPSLEELERRLAARGKDDDETIRRRLREAEREFKERDRFDHVVVNDVADRAAAEISEIIDAYKAQRQNGSSEDC